MNMTEAEERGWARAFAMAGIDLEGLSETFQEVVKAVRQAIEDYEQAMIQVAVLASQMREMTLEELMQELEEQTGDFDAPEATARKLWARRERRRADKQTGAALFAQYCRNSMRWSVKRRTRPRSRAARGPPCLCGGGPQYVVTGVKRT